ncbi:anthranilate phosphoribosyltransferase [Heliocybe sulcata]|uniref:Anthranilate phosphoribosyltransferase n=1 Tax=Heliocybe sulcata TaxID=5364 RepID=A0A5C3MUT4_9AGAM|nr:anthranilate phosphoribosyltransferase [Heliocybe sulcata]
MSNFTPETFRPLLKRLVETPEYFTPSDLKTALDHIFTPDATLPAQVGAFLAALHIHRIERRPDSLAAAAEVLRSRAITADVADADKDFVVDIVGTGGDGHNTFNVSTTAAIVAAGAGARVVKHGSRASTSSSGSADLLQSLGCLFTPPPTALPNIPFTFILAPHYHPALALLAPTRKALPFRTMFNVLGPLINPARPQGMVLGVAEKELGMTFARSLRDGGVVRAMVVCGAEGLDEISCAGETYVWELKNGDIEEKRISPASFGLEAHPLIKVAGGTPQENSETFKALLTSGESIPEEVRPVLDFVLMNASALLVVAGVTRDLQEGVELARKSITSGRAWEALQKFREIGEASAQKMLYLCMVLGCYWYLWNAKLVFAFQRERSPAKIYERPQSGELHDPYRASVVKPKGMENTVPSVDRAGEVEAEMAATSGTRRVMKSFASKLEMMEMIQRCL